MSSPVVRFQCIKERGKVRVRVITPGYNFEANCQFPRAIRQEGKIFEAPVSSLSFSQQRCKFFYRVSPKTIYEVTKEWKVPETVFESSECVICMDKQSEIIFIPCGHFCICLNCNSNLDRKCPMCRAKIEHFATKDQL
jgi:hypothetical protein